MFLKLNLKPGSDHDFKSFSDEELIVAYQKSTDTKYIGELFERYIHLVFGVCMKYLKDEENSKDAVMQIFEDLHHKLVEHEISYFKSWIYSVAKNHCLMILRKSKSELKSMEVLYNKFHHEVMESVDVFHPYNITDMKEKIPKLKKGIELLKKEQRACIELIYLQNKSYQEVSEITGYSLNKVKSHVQNGKRNLKIFLLG
jgi:RNA polymerase sigma factor (sigma-70 family)